MAESEKVMSSRTWRKNPVKAHLSSMLSNADVRMFNALEASYDVLLSVADGLREDGAHPQAELLEGFAEQMQVRVEDMANEVLGEGGGEVLEGGDLDRSGQEVEQISIDDDLARLYADWLTHISGGKSSRVFETRDDAELASAVRYAAHFHPGYGKPLLERVTDEQLIAAAQDSYNEYLRRRG